MSDIFSPIQVKGVNFANRIVMAPMVRFGFPSENGVMGNKLLQDYLGRADKGIGLIISQALPVSKEYEIPGWAGAYSDQHINNLNKIAEACHKNGTKFFAQLALAGFSFYDKDSKDVNNLSKEESAKIRDAFIRGAGICKKAGLDGIELHGAHTFFLNMMASPYSNKRQDEYGGDLVKRLTLVKEIVEAVKSFAGAHFIVSYRMGWSDNLDVDIQTAQALEKIGFDMLHVSTGIPQDRNLQLPTGYEYNDVVYTGCQVKKHVNIPVIAVNSIKTLERGNALIEKNCCDFVAYGKPFLADSGFVKYSKENYGYKPCFECPECKWYTDSKKCPAQIIARSDSL
ncbi:MAG: NADH:flavin oxidoreductase [Desulfuromonadales bacterium]|nr:NADH:flavin oxidoreductase [Desulfuromonadales bacterium]